MIVEFKNSLAEISLGMDKTEIEKRATAFGETLEEVEVLQSKHNILIKQKEFNKKKRTRYIVLFTFNDFEKLIAIKIPLMEKAGFEEVKLYDNVSIKTHEDIIAFIEKGEKYSLTSSCPELDRYIDFAKEGYQKKCETGYYQNCLECKQRSQRTAQAEYSELHCLFSYDIDDEKLTIMNLSYGYDAYHKYFYINEYGDSEIS